VRLAATFLAAGILFGGCEIFLDDWGAEGAPCGGEEDCQEHLFCNTQGHYCTKEVEFGSDCGGPQDCGGQHSECICYPAISQCFCTRPCVDPDGCNDVFARCALVDPLSIETYCTHPSWSYDEFGALCKSQDTTCAAGVCSPFEIRSGGKICVKECGMCPPGASCSEPFNGLPTVCGYPAWFGFWHPCSSNQECGGRFPGYPECHNNANCTKACDAISPCLAGLRCEPAGDGVCVPGE
jgi:hypothetical protein